MKKTLIFIISIAFIISCKPDPPYYKLYPETREWDCYKLNSWWVYKNTETGVLDCVWVTKRIEDIGYFGYDKMAYSFDNISIKLKSSDNYRNYGITIRGKGMVDGDLMAIGCYNSNSDTFAKYYVALLHLNPNIVDSINYLCSKTKVIARFENMNLSGLNFQDVIYVNCQILDCQKPPLSSQYYNALDEFWISKHVGIVKKIIRNPVDTVVWELQKYGIVK